LLLIVDALNTFGLLLGFGQRRQKHGRQYGNDSNNHQQLNESETPRTMQSRLHGGRIDSRLLAPRSSRRKPRLPHKNVRLNA
jgi:hypothetical protein